MPGWRTPAVLAGTLGFTGVLMAALGAHAIEGLGDTDAYRAWQAANLLHLAHAGVLLAIASLVRHTPSRGLVINAFVIFTGVVLFSGTIYLRQSFGIALGANVAPAGGLLLLGGWLALIVALVRS